MWKLIALIAVARSVFAGASASYADNADAASTPTK